MLATPGGNSLLFRLTSVTPHAKVIPFGTYYMKATPLQRALLRMLRTCSGSCVMAPLLLWDFIGTIFGVRVCCLMVTAVLGTFLCFSPPFFSVFACFLFPSALGLLPPPPPARLAMPLPPRCFIDALCPMLPGVPSCQRTKTLAQAGLQVYGMPWPDTAHGQ